MKCAFITAVPLLGVLLLAASVLSGCNTIKGAGQDLKSAGQAIERTAQKSKPY
jgi:entericidin B